MPERCFWVFELMIVFVESLVESSLEPLGWISQKKNFLIHPDETAGSVSVGLKNIHENFLPVR